MSRTITKLAKRRRPRNFVLRAAEPENFITTYKISSTPEGDYIEISADVARRLSRSNFQFYFETRFAHEKTSDETTAKPALHRPVTSTEGRDPRANTRKTRIQPNRKAWKAWRQDPTRLPSGYRKAPARHYLLPEAGNITEHNQADSEVGSNRRATNPGPNDRG